MPYGYSESTQGGHRQRIKNSMSIIEAIDIMGLSAQNDYNPGAVSACGQLVVNAPAILPECFPIGILAVLDLDQMGIYEEDIWILFNKVCGQNLHRILALLYARHARLEGIETSTFHRAIKAKSSEGIDFRSIAAAVKKLCPSFDIEAALEGLDEADMSADSKD